MRHAGILAFVFTAGCSLVWSMDDYEGGSGADARPDGGDDDVGAGSSGASTSSGATSSSGAASGSSGSTGDAGADAAKDAETCIDEPEPNGNAASPVEIPVGVTCGAILTSGDIDNYKATTAAGATLTFEIGPGIQVVINPEGAGGSENFFAPGSYQKTFPAGKHSVIFQTYDGTGGYKIRR